MKILLCLGFLVVAASFLDTQMDGAGDAGKMPNAVELINDVFCFGWVLVNGEARLFPRKGLSSFPT
jgi:hypothetical protein